jgi:hypothetical protein
VSVDRVRQLADAVLLEGYVLYPYRASAPKNRYRFLFGVLAPRAWSERGGCEPWWLEAQVLVEARGAPRVDGTLRFLQAKARVGAAAPEPVGGALGWSGGPARLAPWLEGDVRELELRELVAPGRAGAERVLPFELPGGAEALPGAGAPGEPRAFQRWPVQVEVRVSSEPVVTPATPLVRLSIRVENVTPWGEPRASRDEALRASCLATHLILSVNGGAFVSLVDPPPHARAAAAACRNVRTFPVLAGDPARRDLMLSASIILPDHPRLAPESPGDSFEATEIEELLALRTAALTDAEKREARATDPRAAAVIDRAEAMPPEILGRLHGALRGLRDAEMVPRGPSAAGDALAPGGRVRLRPGPRRTDAQDLLFAGCTATVRAVLRDAEDREWVAVTIDDDPAAELHEWYGRYHYYHLDEVEPLPAPGGGAP